jgi:hypothetical protein
VLNLGSRGRGGSKTQPRTTTSNCPLTFYRLLTEKHDRKGVFPGKPEQQPVNNTSL